MRILELINRLNDGGAERIASSLALGLQAQGNTVSIVCLRDFGRMPVSKERLERGGVELVEFLKDDGFSPRVFRRLVDFVKTHEIDVIHTHNPLVHHYGVLAALRTHSPVVVQTVHGIGTLQMHNRGLSQALPRRVRHHRQSRVGVQRGERCHPQLG